MKFYEPITFCHIFLKIRRLNPAYLNRSFYRKIMFLSRGVCLVVDRRSQTKNRLLVKAELKPKLSNMTIPNFGGQFARLRFNQELVEVGIIMAKISWEGKKFRACLVPSLSRRHPPHFFRRSCGGRFGHHNLDVA
jgi:hypothetical protein